MKQLTTYGLLVLGTAAIGAAVWDPTLLPHVGGVALVLVTFGLTTFTACASIPTNPDEAAKAIEILNELRDKKEQKDDLTAKLKAKQEEGVGDKLLNWAKSFVWTPETEEQIQQKIEDIDAQIEYELSKIPPADKLKESLEKLKEAAEKTNQQVGQVVNEQGSQQVRIAMLVPGLPASASRLIGLREYLSTLDEAMERALPVIDQKLELVEVIATEVAPLRAAFRKSRKAAAIAASSRVTVRAMVKAFGVIDSASIQLGEFLDTMLRSGFQDDLDSLRRLAELLNQPQVTALISRRADYEKPPLRVQARFTIDATMLGRVRRGDTLVIELPRGYHLTAPLSIRPSRSLRIAVTGNAAGSCVVAMRVRRSSGTPRDSIRVTMNQRIEIGDGACGSSELRIRNLDNFEGLTVPVTTMTL